MKKRIIPAIISILMCVILICGYQIYLQLKEYKIIDELNEGFLSSVLMEYEVEDETTDESTETETNTFEFLNYDHEAALAINSEAMGLLYIPATETTCLITQTTNNSYYLKHAFDKSYSAAGCPYIDSRCTEGLDSSHIIIYGHNMKNQSMFGKNKQLLDYSLYSEEGNNVFYIYGDGYVRTYLIYMVGRVAAESENFVVSFDSQEELIEYAQKIQSYSNYDTGVDISEATQIVTLSTCTTYGAKYSHRLFIQGMLISETNTKTGETTTSFTYNG